MHDRQLVLCGSLWIGGLNTKKRHGSTLGHAASARGQGLAQCVSVPRSLIAQQGWVSNDSLQGFLTATNHNVTGASEVGSN